MKLTLLALCAIAGLLTACATHENRDSNRNVYEPSGAENTNNVPTQPQARDINQNLYPGTQAPDPGYDSSFDMRRNLNTRGPSGAQSFDMNPRPVPPNAPAEQK